MLTADAFGVLPPIARLTPQGAMYHFLSGYTAKVAGTEKGVTEPERDVQHLLRRAVSAAAAGLLRADARREDRPASRRASGSSTPAGAAVPTASGRRMKIAPHARDDQRGAVGGARSGRSTRRDPFFNLDVPTSCPGVPPDVLNPRKTWTQRRRLRRAGGASSRGCSSRTSRTSKPRWRADVRCWPAPEA